MAPVLNMSRNLKINATGAYAFFELSACFLDSEDTRDGKRESNQRRCYRA